MEELEVPLSGGNTHAAIVRVGETVRRPTGPWTPAVHGVLAHLAARGVAAPRALGIDERGREILSFIPGDVIWPDHVDLIRDDSTLREVGRSIRSMHDAVADYVIDPASVWSARAADPSGSTELLCHNDLGLTWCTRAATGSTSTGISRLPAVDRGMSLSRCSRRCR